MLKCIKIIFFYILKIIFEVNTLKRFKIHKKINFYKIKIKFSKNIVCMVFGNTLLIKIHTGISSYQKKNI
jgi:hypothetical protein